ncbi:MAG TPA: YbdK family carboxylate-amine ligase [Gaiellaceae bacterium]
MSQLEEFGFPSPLAEPHLTAEPDRIDRLAESYERGFAQGFLPTVGVEEELMLVDPETLEPAEIAATVLEELSDPRFAAELRTAQIELVMPVCLTVGDVCRELGSARSRLVESLGGRTRVLAAGTHPSATVPVGVTDKARYRQIAYDHPTAVRAGMTCGLHVHVGVVEPDEALAVYNAARSYLPEIAALAANSPYLGGIDTRLSSNRLKLTEELPRAGIPPAFASWRDLAGFVAWASEGELFPDLSYLWWELRPRPEYGTLEFRVADAQTSIDGTAAIAAVCQSLVVALGARYRAGEELPVHASHVLNENRWRALRDGVESVLVDPVTGVAEPARHRIGRLLLELEPHAACLGCADELSRAWPLLAADGACRQRAVAAGEGVRGLLEWLANETELPARREASSQPWPTFEG